MQFNYIQSNLEGGVEGAEREVSEEARIVLLAILILLVLKNLTAISAPYPRTGILLPTHTISIQYPHLTAQIRLYAI